MIIQIEEYILDVLMRDLTGHDRSVSSYLVYLHLWTQSRGKELAVFSASHQQMAEATGLSKSAVQNGVRNLVRRKLIRIHKASATAVPEYRVLTPWKR